MDEYKLFHDLLRAEDENEVDRILQDAGFLNDDHKIWQPFGGFEMNYSQIGNQQAEPTPALVEKLINSIDAVLMAECYRANIDPRDEKAPRTMAEAVEKFFKVRDGRLENLTPRQRTALADNIHMIVTGSKSAPCYLVIDKGEGQTPASFEKTFLSLTRRNKDDIPFVQGRFNCGGTGVLPFCGQQNYQLVASRRNPCCPAEQGDSTKDSWGFTIVRKLRPSKGRKSSMYVYLAPQNQILSFTSADGIPVLAGQSSKNKPAPAYSIRLPYGSCIKLYNYRWKKKGPLTTDGRYELERFLHSVCLPFRLSETREYKANYYSTTVSGIIASTNDEGKEEIDPNSKFEADFSPAYGELSLPQSGRLPYRIYLLKEEHIRYSRDFPHGVFFTLNGQVHGDLPANFVNSTLKFDCLSTYLMVSVDCTHMNAAVREDFMMASRDRVRRNEIYDEIYETLREELKEHPGLRQHNALRKQKRLEETLSNQEKTIDYFQELLKGDPTLASILGTGGHVISTTGPAEKPEPFFGKKFPTYFRIAKEPKGGLVKACPVNRSVRVDFETDAVNDYFVRADCPGSITFDPPNLCVSSRLWNGRFTTKFQMPYDGNVGDSVTIKVSVTDIERESKGSPFFSQFQIKGAPEAQDDKVPPPGKATPGKKPQDNGNQAMPSLAIPKIREVRREKWDDALYQFTEYSAVKIINDDETNGYIFFVNVDNKFLINELHRSKEEEKALVKHRFIYGVVLAGLGMMGELQRQQKEKEPDNNESGGKELELDTVNKFCAGVSRVIVPIIRALYKGPATVEQPGRE